ncbi:PREDICTED: pachytene checkpoint protein 2 homolog [Priapulus caudatus]|uniref:Pachytene checkpoint protein 2 homolog n=1 Tax=Priapulus caudatus TaxID=37621 RepID=A0ABM1EGW0_PRICU|nr:PREDICTED: pachytene checkpoint protein 2 homolog [Priapulus caudatus]
MEQGDYCSTRRDENCNCNSPHTFKPVIHVEVCRSLKCVIEDSILKERVMILLQNIKTITDETIIPCKVIERSDPLLGQNVNSICLYHSDVNHYSGDKRVSIALEKAHLTLHIYSLSDGGPVTEELDDEDLAAANNWILPAREFNGIWENLIFESDIKAQLLNYALTTLLYSDKQIDSNIISWNKVILLHGPPGTGKTSLCKALAHKLCILMSDRYTYGQLVEINSHSLFSKWFSESGKLVMKMFRKIEEFIEDPRALICVLIDEVESLTAARKAAMSGTEPSDSIRVVNAVLTQIDQIKRHPNVIILTTSNVTGAIDLAFVDRADIKQYIGPPSPAAIYKIFTSCIRELMRAGIIIAEDLWDYSELQEVNKVSNMVASQAAAMSLELFEAAKKSEGLSGRALRKLPFIAHSLYIQVPQVDLRTFVSAIGRAIEKQLEERDHLEREAV